MHYLLIYEIAPDYLERRAQFRDSHLTLAWESHRNGHLVLGGALGNPVDGAALLFCGDSSEGAEAFARADPYVVNGLVTSWQVRAWNTVAGETATNPIYPASEITPSSAGTVDR
jgi:uncharacterized protein YciI